VLGYIPSFEKLVPIVFSGLVMGGFFYLFSGLHFAVRAALGAGLYFFLLWIFRAISTHEIASLLRRGGGEAREHEIIA